ncbi:MAG: hypothetical protein GQ564_09430 [Bacteroidales bacterium]|nr:hypothetical protein [Bacteroidales bacterium]
MKKLKFIFYIISVILIYSCEDENTYVKPAVSNQDMEDFTSVWNRANEVYPFFELKRIDWDSIYIVYHPRVEAARDDEFYFVLHDLLTELKDGHIMYTSEGGGLVVPYIPHRSIKDKNVYSPFVVSKYFESELLLTESETTEYGITPDNIGYIYLSNFLEKYLLKEFSGVIEYLKNTKGLIIDLRNNPGGDIVNVEAVVSRFITEPLEWPKIYFLGVRREMNPILPQGSFTYTNSVIVLINGVSFSAAEVAPEIFKQLSNVTIVGDTTAGAAGSSSDRSQETNSKYRLPSGKIVYIPTGHIKRYDGQHIEWNGVPPDIRVEQTENDIIKGIDKQLEFAINMLK